MTSSAALIVSSLTWLKIDQHADAVHLVDHGPAESVRPCCFGTSVALSAQSLVLKWVSVM